MRSNGWAPRLSEMRGPEQAIKVEGVVEYRFTAIISIEPPERHIYLKFLATTRRLLVQ